MGIDRAGEKISPINAAEETLLGLISGGDVRGEFLAAVAIERLRAECKDRGRAVLGRMGDDFSCNRSYRSPEELAQIAEMQRTEEARLLDYKKCSDAVERRDRERRERWHSKCRDR